MGAQASGPLMIMMRARGPRSGYSIFTPASWTIFFHLTFSRAM